MKVIIEGTMNHPSHLGGNNFHERNEFNCGVIER